MRRAKTVGVLGGMGPAATVEFFRRLVGATAAAVDQDHLRILIDNDPTIPDRTAGILGRGPSPAPALTAMARGLVAAGAQLLAMPCNTAHVYLPEIRGAVDVPFIDMPEETVAAVAERRVGLLVTDGTISTGLFHRPCERRGIEAVVPGPDDQRTVMETIVGIKAGGAPRSFEPGIAAVVERLRRAGAESVIAGCTEISLLSPGAMPLPWHDALEILVHAVIREAYNT